MTTLSTRSLCDECGRPADRETDSGIFICERCAAPPVNSVSGEIPESISGPSLATGMSSDRLTAGGNHEAVTALSLSTEFNVELETGTSPGAGGTERGRVGASNPVAKATEGKAGTAVVTGHVRRSTAGTGLRVGEVDAVRPATSENNGRDSVERHATKFQSALAPAMAADTATDPPVAVAVTLNTEPALCAPERAFGEPSTLFSTADRSGIIKRFLEKVGLSNSLGCTPWTSQVGNHGYGVFSINGSKQQAHRAAWEIFIGKIPDGMWVLHACDVPTCVNLEHLFLGSHQDNVDDMMRKGRHRAGKYERAKLHPCRGELACNSRLTEANALDALRRATCGETLCSIAAVFGVAVATISAVVRGKTWKHLPRPVGLPRARVRRTAVARCIGVDGSSAPDRDAYPGRASAASDAGIVGPQDSISNPDASSHPPASVNCGAVSPPAAAPLSIPADPEIEAAVSALEVGWVRANISLANTAFCLKNSTSFAMRAFAPMSANRCHASSSDISNPSISLEA